MVVARGWKKGRMGGRGIHLIGNVFSVLQDEESSGDKLHNNVNVLDTIEL